MDVELFQKKLPELISECGGTALGNMTVVVMGGKQWRASLDDMYERSEQPLKIIIEVRVQSLGEWRPSVSSS